MDQEERKFLGTPVDVPRNGICSGCRQIFKISGSPRLGYIIPAHHSLDLKKAKAGKNCEGSNTPPYKVHS